MLAKKWRSCGVPHNRHYFASLLIASGLDVKVVQARLRHASAKTTLDTSGRTGMTPHKPRSRPSTRKREKNSGLLRDESLRRLLRGRRDADGLIRARREDVFVPVEIGQVVSVDRDEAGGFAQVVKFDGDPETGWVCLQELLGKEAEQAA